jgi:hypothetical protein
MSLKDKAQVSPAEVDILLLPFLKATAKEDEELLLSRLLEEHISPVIRQILRLKMQWYFDPREGGYRDPDMDEAYHEIQLHLLRRLLDFKRHPEWSKPPALPSVGRHWLVPAAMSSRWWMNN